jgi:epoxyqueuosine reductase QueG
MDVKESLLEMYEQDDDKYFEDPELGPLFDRPTVRIADARDPWFARFKEVIGEFHWTPAEALELVNPDAEPRSVVSWSLPVAEPARRANREEGRFPHRLWAYVRTFGERSNNRLRRGLAELLTEAGHAAAAPFLLPDCSVEQRPKVGLAANWSERHVAFVAGLGTFSISGGLITDRGIAHRLGSVVTSLELEPTPRPYGDDPFAWCLRSARGTCGVCIERCPAGSIGESVHEREKGACAAHTGRVGRECREEFGWEGIYGCGLCQTDVPCESTNPVSAGG